MYIIHQLITHICQKIYFYFCFGRSKLILFIFKYNSYFTFNFSRFLKLSIKEEDRMGGWRKEPEVKKWKEREEIMF